MNRVEQVRYYRETAAKLREIAAAVLDPDVKHELLGIAAKFATLADWAENQRHDCTE